MSPGPNLVTDPLLQTQLLVTTLASHHSRGNLCLYVVLSLSHGINSRQGCSNSPHSIDITMSRLSSQSRDQFSTVALWCRGPSRPGPRHRDGSWARGLEGYLGSLLVTTDTGPAVSVCCRPRSPHRQHSNYFLNRHKIFPRTRPHHGQV